MNSKILSACFLCLLLAACAGFKAVDADKPVNVGDDITIQPQVAWANAFGPGISGTVWTIDGLGLNELRFLTGIVPEGTNSHTFEPPPSVAATLASSNVVFVNGLVLEEPTKDAQRRIKPRASRGGINATVAELRWVVATEAHAEHHSTRRKRLGRPFEQKAACDVHEGRFAVRQHVEPDRGDGSHERRDAPVSGARSERGG